jgi:hypothetical protein
MSKPIKLIRRLAKRWTSARQPQARPGQRSDDAEGNAELAAPSAERDPEWPQSEDARLQRLSIDG